MASQPEASDRADDVYEAAVRAHRSGRLDEAEQGYRQVLHAAPRHSGTLFLLGKLLSDRGDNEQGIKLLRKAIDTGLEEAAVYFQLGLAYVKTGRHRRARQSFEQSALLQPGNPAPHIGLGDVHRALGDPAAAIASYRKALARNPASAEAKAGLGAALMDADQPAEAIAPLSEALAAAPESAAAHMSLAGAFMADGEAARATDLYRRACELAPDLAAARVGLGTALERRGSLEEAVAAYRAGLERSPGHADTLALLGRALNGLKRHDEAIAALEQATGEGRGSPLAWSQLVMAHAEMGRVGEAREAARRGLEHHRDNVEILAALGELDGGASKATEGA